MKKKKSRIGVVISNKMNKTIVVEQNKIFKHPRYEKSFLIKKKYFVHDEKNISNIGDIVRFVEVRPISKKKYCKLIKIENIK
ncbi:30S ribosomal protein S17 [Candidatus Shikimatogenerans silvanidophilus]|uniref:30S ribosomal protein S17 n=1 Tax=Candidatus Shikimatogenerans silvanidophilus TaxID=2782547 RepID=UPI001BA70A7E|nr:30S ribosomal protein S17 [Candidatus Shikimatogenerans silvanidophilus]